MARLVNVVLVLAAAWLVLVTLAWALQRSLIYLPDRSAPTVPAGVAEVTLRTADGLELTAWEVVPEREPSTAVLVAPGNAGHRAYRMPLATALADRGHAVLLLDYRGYGGNPGRPHEDGLVADARAAHRHLADRYGPERVVHLGESLGSGVVAALAVTDPPAGLVLRSPFPSLVEVGRRHYPFLPVGTLLRDRYPVIDHLAGYDGPVLVVLGDRDRIVPPDLSAVVAAAVDVEATAIADADHNDAALLDGSDYLDALDAFLRRIAAEG